MMRWIFILVALFGAVQVYSQTMAQQADSLHLFSQRIGSANNDKQRMRASDKLEELAARVLKRDSAFSYPFQSLKKVSTIASGDGRVRLFNWNVPMESGPQYRAFVLVKKRKNRPQKVYVLKDSIALTHDLEKRQLFPNEWYGALYYDIKELEASGRDYYIILGWDGHDEVSTKKVMDVLYLRGDKVRLGAPLLSKESETLYRDVFEYTNDASMLLRYFPDREEFVFDHLEPLPEGVKGEYAFYAPTLSFDAYSLSGKGSVEFKEHIDFKRPGRNKQFKEPEPPDFSRERSKINPLTGKPLH